ncbi:MAG: hypothetical protein AAF485_22310, partial [Chloroflexota bacterium]
STMGLGSGKGSLALFQQVEVELPSAFAQAAATAGVRRAVLLTSAGADLKNTRSWLVPWVAQGQFFYLKGKIEQHFIEMGFQEGVTIFRPGGLLGTDHVPQWLDTFLPKLNWMIPSRWRFIHITELANAMAHVIVKPIPISLSEVTYLEGGALHTLSSSNLLEPSA